MIHQRPSNHGLLRRSSPNGRYGRQGSNNGNGLNLGPFSLMLIGGVLGVICFCMSDPACSLDSLIGFVPSGSSSATDNDLVIVNGHYENDVIVRIEEPPENYAFQPKLKKKVRSSKRLFQKMPSKARRTFYSVGSRIHQPMQRALRELGWYQVQSVHEARFIYTYIRKISWYDELESWQRPNHIPETYHWNKKDSFVDGLHNWEKKTGKEAWFVPDTFRLTLEEEKQQFQDRLFKHGGINKPWVLKLPNVNQGKGITFLGPQSDELRTVVERTAGTNYIIQEYVCNEMTWAKRKFDVRMYWLVASLDPLIALYQDGYVRVGNANYDETNFNNTRSHLTTHTFLGEEGKGSMDDLAVEVTKIWKANPKLRQTIADPVSHVRNQFKASLAAVVDAFKGDGLSFTTEHLTGPEDSFEFYGADFVLDNDLDVWLIEPQDDTGMDEDHYFRLNMHHNLFYGMALVLDEIWDKQESGKPILPIKNTGKWELIYADNWMYEYEGYKRQDDKKSCGIKK